MILLNAVMDIEGLIKDLAFILLLGAIVTIVFKWIKQPVVLGYIVAGFLASPNFEPLPSVTTDANIEFWAQIGIVVLLFSLGLEFSFKKLVNVGGSALVTALIIVAGMMATGSLIGHVLGFSSINCLFLGGMLSMSSTTIIIKAFTDMGLRQKKFASMVFAVLIVEDLFAVVMMVVLSSIAVNNSVEGGEMLMSVGKLVFFLVLWFVAGTYALPSLLNVVRRWLNAETLLVVSMGLCLSMAVLSVMCGFSMALGAFVMGSILAGTSYAERIEKVTEPVKDLFGAVFFISVGMMVQPAVIVEYAFPILILSGVVILGMITFGTVGMLATGQSLRVAIESGFALTQIGEFAFIIASLGMSLGVLNPTIYPMVVAVSVITTFLTPYFIRMADPVYRFIERHMPRRLHFLIDRIHEQAAEGESVNERSAWIALARKYVWRILLYSIILIAISMLSARYIRPELDDILPRWSHLVGLGITLLAMSPFLMALCLPPSGRSDAERERLASPAMRLPRFAIMVVRLIVAVAFVVNALVLYFPMKVVVALVIGVVFVFALLWSKRVRKRMRSIETKFINNLNERELRRTGRNNTIVSDLHLAYMQVGYSCPFVGERLVNSGLRSQYGVDVVNIQRGSTLIPVPSGDTRIFPGDVIGVIGTDDQIDRLAGVVESPEEESAPAEQPNVKFTSVTLSDASPLIGQTIAGANVRRNYQAHVVALERDGQFPQPAVSTPLQAGDRLWMVGDPRLLRALE